MEYTVTLTQKVKTAVEAESPQEALEQSRAAVVDRKFEPGQFAVKES
jgi:hypothetical protein